MVEGPMPVTLGGQHELASVRPKPQTLWELTNVSQKHQHALERDAARFMDGHSLKSGWVMEDWKTGIVMEDQTRDQVFLNHHAVKRLIRPEWRYSLIA